MKKKIVSLLLVLALCAGLSVPALAAAPTFADVPASFWAYDGIERAFRDGAINGTSYDPETGIRYFSPDTPLTLAQFIVILCRGFYADEMAEAEAAKAAGAAWYAPAQSVAAKHGLLVSVSGGMNEPASRYDMSALIYNLVRSKTGPVETSGAGDRFVDWNTMPQKYQASVSAVSEWGIINGYNTGAFVGIRTVNRAQAAILYMRTADFLTSQADDPQEGPATEPIAPPVEEEPDPVTPSSNIPADLNGDGIVTDEEVLEKLEELKSKYPDNGKYDPNVRYRLSVPIDGEYVNGLECARLAYEISDSLFYGLPVRSHTDLSKVRPGDMIYSDSPHWKVATGYATEHERIDGAYRIPIVSGGSAGVIDWATTTDYQGERVVYTRYPE